MKKQIKDPFTISPDFQSLPEVSSRYWGKARQIQNNGEANFSINDFHHPMKFTYSFIISLCYAQYVQTL